jgi:hypothetical protein
LDAFGLECTAKEDLGCEEVRAASLVAHRSSGGINTPEASRTAQ